MSMGGGLAASSSAVRLSRVRIVAVILCCCRVVGVCCPFRPRVPWSRSLSASAGRVGGGVKKQTVSLY